MLSAFQTGSCCIKASRTKTINAGSDALQLELAAKRTALPTLNSQIGWLVRRIRSLPPLIWGSHTVWTGPPDGCTELECARKCAQEHKQQSKKYRLLPQLTPGRTTPEPVPAYFYLRGGACDCTVADASGFKGLGMNL